MGNIGKLLGKTDVALAALYSDWSEATYCAGWMNNGYEEFVDWLLDGEHEVDARGGLEDYERLGVVRIRRLLVDRLCAHR